MAYLEFHLSGGAARTTRRTEQFLYRAAKETDGDPDGEGTTLAAARKVLRSRGVCTNATWGYQPMPGTTEGQGPPPGEAVAEARKTRWTKSRDLAHGDVDALRSTLDHGRPVVLGVKTFPNWDFPSVADTGEITYVKKYAVDAYS